MDQANEIHGFDHSLSLDSSLILELSARSEMDPPPDFLGRLRFNGFGHFVSLDPSCQRNSFPLQSGVGFRLRHFWRYGHTDSDQQSADLSLLTGLLTKKHLPS